MPLYLKEILKNSSTRVLAIILGFLILVSGLFSWYSYIYEIESLKEREIAKLDAIAKTIASQIDGEVLDEINKRYKQKDEIGSNKQDEHYQRLHQLLKEVRKTNNLPSDIYTTVYKPSKEHFEFLVSSSENTYFKHEWKEFPPSIIENLQNGGSIKKYNTENGSWLSSYVPIETSENDFSYLVHVDMPFDDFIAAARNRAKQRTGGLIIGLILVTLVFYFIIHKIIKNEMTVKGKLSFQNQQIRLKNKNILDSIHSAKRIQESILPPIGKIKREFPEFFVVYKPKDIVSGDFFWYYTIGDISYLAVSDCTGHGVPGAMVTMLGQAILRDIIKGYEDISPAEILSELNDRLAKSINHNTFDIPEGMDISMCRMSRKDDTIEYAGAFRPMLMIRDGQMEVINGNRYSIGGIKGHSKQFDNKLIHVQPGDRFYLYTDGYCDQFGGDNGKKYMSKRFRNFILQSQDLRMEDQMHLFNYEFHLWQNEEEQVDDVLVAGFEIPGLKYPKKSYLELKSVA